jgi:hypothetical protein
VPPRHLTDTLFAEGKNVPLQVSFDLGYYYINYACNILLPPTPSMDEFVLGYGFVLHTQLHAVSMAINELDTLNGAFVPLLSNFFI